MPKNKEIKRFSTQDGNEICFPVGTIVGDKPGPHVLITGGIHGCEYPGIVSAIRLFQELKPEDICGEVTIITISSVKAFETRSVFVVPVDGKNVNRCFPGKLDGTYADALAYYLLHEFIAKADFYIDLHGGDMVEALLPFSIYHGGEGNETERLSKEIVDYYGLKHVVMSVPGGAWDDSGTTYANAAKLGVPGAIVEVGGVGLLLEADVEQHLWGLRNVLRHVKCLKGEAVKPEGIQYYQGMSWVMSPAEGICYVQVKVGETIKKGQKVACVEDYFGELLAEVFAPCDGILVFLTTSPAMKNNGLIMGIGIK